MASSTTVQSGGVGPVSLLTILFVALKLTEVIDWSWWWVLSPLWICAGFWGVVLLAVVVGAAIAYHVGKRRLKARMKNVSWDDVSNRLAAKSRNRDEFEFL